MLAEIVRRIDGAGLEIAELALRRPSLDDVFLALTGRRAEETPPADTTATAPGRALAPALRPQGEEKAA